MCILPFVHPFIQIQVHFMSLHIVNIHSFLSHRSRTYDHQHYLHVIHTHTMITNRCHYFVTANHEALKLSHRKKKCMRRVNNYRYTTSIHVCHNRIRDKTCMPLTTNHQTNLQHAVFGHFLAAELPRTGLTAGEMGRPTRHIRTSDPDTFKQ